MTMVPGFAGLRPRNGGGCHVQRFACPEGAAPAAPRAEHQIEGAEGAADGARLIAREEGPSGSIPVSGAGARQRFPLGAEESRPDGRSHGRSGSGHETVGCGGGDGVYGGVVSIDDGNRADQASDDLEGGVRTERRLSFQPAVTSPADACESSAGTGSRAGDSPQAQHASAEGRNESGSGDYWMRYVAFAGLHRLLCRINATTSGHLTAGEVDRLVRKHNIRLGHRARPPSRTTLYHYRNTLLRLGVLRRDGSFHRINGENPHVRALLAIQPPSDRTRYLPDSAREHFSALVLQNPQCRSLFFDLFSSSAPSTPSVKRFRNSALPVHWARLSPNEISITNSTTGRTLRCASRASIAAIPYGIRYWARDELNLVDEYWCPITSAAVMYPIHSPPSGPAAARLRLQETIRLILSWRNDDDWTSFSISRLIARVCRERRQPRSLLFRVLDWLLAKWPHHTVPIATTRGLATLTASSPQQQELLLRTYYRVAKGPYISHIRLHRAIVLDDDVNTTPGDPL